MRHNELNDPIDIERELRARELSSKIAKQLVGYNDREMLDAFAHLLAFVEGERNPFGSRKKMLRLLDQDINFCVGLGRLAEMHPDDLEKYIAERMAERTQ
jgi:hypothetical protein